MAIAQNLKPLVNTKVFEKANENAFKKNTLKDQVFHRNFPLFTLHKFTFISINIPFLSLRKAHFPNHEKELRIISLKARNRRFKPHRH